MNKDEKYQNLEIINSWINNADTKISYMLAFIGIIATIMFTNDTVVEAIKSYIDNLLTFTIKDFINLISIGILILLAVLLFYISRSIYYLLNASTARIKDETKQKDSILFFGNIANNQNFEEFKQKVKNNSEQEIEDDILKQIYINSNICNKKFENYNKAIKDIRKALILLFVIIMVTFFSI